jgi:hypothetical protein
LDAVVRGRFKGRASRETAMGAKASNMNKYLKNAGLKVRQIISLLRAPTSLDPALLLSRESSIIKQTSRHHHTSDNVHWAHYD